MPPSPRLLWLSLLPLPPLLYDQYLRSLYPTRRVPPALEIARRTDQPFGNVPPREDGAPPHWTACAAGDTWTAVVPRVWLTRQQEVDGKRVVDEVVLARAFWGSWPLWLEPKLIKVAMACRVPIFKGRAGKEGLTQEEKDTYAEGTPMFEETGLFLVEKHDAHPPPLKSTDTSTIAGPMIASFYFNVPPFGSSTYGLLGGYHSLSVHDLPSRPEEVELAFTSHGIWRTATGEIAQPRETGDGMVAAGKGEFGKTWSGAVLGEVHEVYSRYLLHCAVLRLRSGKKL